MGKSGVEGKMKKQRYDLNDLGSNVKMMRKARKMSQPHLSNLECGRTLISLEILVKLADVFDCSVEDILLCSQEKVKAVN